MRFSVQSYCKLFFGALAVLARAGDAQSSAGAEAGPTNATRQQLERLVAEAASAASIPSGDGAGRMNEFSVAAIRERLREGDFRPGDRIVVAVAGDSAWTDTLTVLSGTTLSVLSFPQDSLRGVLRSELQSHLSTWFTRFYKNATVTATPLIQFGILGEVNRPGYYRLPINIAVADAIMAAGGPTQRADMPGTVVRRRSRQVLSKAAMRDAIAAGLTLDQLGLAAGDELVVGAKKDRGWQTFVQLGGIVSGLALAVRALQR